MRRGGRERGRERESGEKKGRRTKWRRERRKGGVGEGE